MSRRLPILLGLLFAVATAAAEPAEPDATALVRQAIDYWRGTSSFTVVEMTVHRPEWQRSSVMRSWTRGQKDALVRFVEPAKDAGSATLKVGDDMWIFTPRVNRVIKLPFSMMAQSWMGSDFSYNDLAKSDRLVTQYDSRIVERGQRDGHTVYRIESIPKPEAPVIWGKQTVLLRDDHAGETSSALALDLPAGLAQPVAQRPSHRHQSGGGGLTGGTVRELDLGRWASTVSEGEPNQ